MLAGAARWELIDFVLNARPSHDDAQDGGFPTSFLVEPVYWQAPDAQDRRLVGSAVAIWQRTMVQHGLNLYCAACRQIALATTGRPDAIEAADRHTRMLLDDRIGETEALRGWSDRPGEWRYGDERVSLGTDQGSAFFFGAICDRFRLTDPLGGQASLPPELGGGPLCWNQFDPFLGENSWAALLGPLQVAYLKANGRPVPPDCDELRLALSLVPACLAMQSPDGGVYARPASWGRPQERLISNETNLTLYAGLCMLDQVLPDALEFSARRAQVATLRRGLLAYFRRHLCGTVDGELRFHACGIYLDGGFHPGVTADRQPARFAADVHTWGMSILGVAEIEAWHGRGACLRLWEGVKRHAGFYPPAAALGGIGFSSEADGAPIHDVCSPEWTFGAINMCRILAAEYEAAGPYHDQDAAARLRADEASMRDGVRQFEMSPPARPPSRAYPYVNRIAETGFGWQGLPVPSLCATAWAVLCRQGFNPFRLGGEAVSAHGWVSNMGTV